MRKYINKKHIISIFSAHFARLATIFIRLATKMAEILLIRYNE